MESITSKLSQLLQLYYKYYTKRIALDELIFFVTYNCNFRCKTCFYVEVMDDSKADKYKELSIEEINKISKFLRSISKLLLSGGEPFLREDLDEIYEIF